MLIGVVPFHYLLFLGLMDKNKKKSEMSIMSEVCS